MNYKKVFWGIVLVLLGLLLILKNTGVIWFSWQSIWHLWPVLLILWGVSMIPVKDYIKLVISLLIIAGSGTFLYFQHDKLDDNFNIHWNIDDENDDFDFDNDKSGTTGSQFLEENWDSTIRTATLQFDAAAGAFKIEGNTAKLIEFNKSGDACSYSMETEKIGDSSVINVDMHGKGENTNIKNNGDKASIKLNQAPLWIMNFDVGAVSMNLDLTPYKVSEVNLDGGASSIEMKIGKLQKVANIDIETGASSIKILIPKESACEIKTSTFLTSRRFDGFKRVERGVYRSDNFNAQLPIIYIDLESAISNLDIERY